MYFPYGKKSKSGGPKLKFELRNGHFFKDGRSDLIVALTPSP